MRILVAHNRYQHRGGEDAVVEAEIELLRSKGHEVATYFRHNDEIETIPRIQLARQAIWSKRTYREAANIFADFKPEIIHAHNTLPLISPSLYWAASRAQIPVVQTLHNFRLLCPQGLLLRNGSICEDCLGKVPWRGVVHGCYRESFIQTAVVASMLTFHRKIGTWQNQVARYIALNNFCRKKFIEGGITSDLIDIKPNFVESPVLRTEEREGFLFAGRLSSEKGIATLANAARLAPEVQIRVAGTGPELERVSTLGNLNLLGNLDSKRVFDEMFRATALILPSIWYENFPRVIVEAFACGLPVIATRLGAITEIIEDGVTGILVEPGNASDLATKIQWASSNRAKMAEMGLKARKTYETLYTPDHNYERLISIYRSVLGQSQI